MLDGVEGDEVESLAREGAPPSTSVSEACSASCRPSHGSRPSQTWRTFPDNHVGSLVSIDFFTVPTATFRVLYVFFVLAHDRRRVLRFNVTEHRSAVWTALQIVEAFPEDTIPRFMIRDRDCIFGDQFRRRVQGLGIEGNLTAPWSPWQNPYPERLVRSVRRAAVSAAGETAFEKVL
jgi:putative transposase